VTFDPIRKVCLAETIYSNAAARLRPILGNEGSVMAAADGGLPLLTESDVDALAWQFLNSEYVGDVYAQYSLDQRIGNLLRRSGLVRVADDDLYNIIYNIILDRIMSGISSLPGKANRSPAAVRPTC
jgi:hypothetical protein